MEALFNDNTLTVKDNEIILAIIPFSWNGDHSRVSTCAYICRYSEYCEQLISGTRISFRDLCLAAPAHTYPDISKLEISAKSLHNRLKEAIVKKKFPKPKEL